MSNVQQRISAAGEGIGLSDRSALCVLNGSPRAILPPFASIGSASTNSAPLGFGDSAAGLVPRGSKSRRHRCPALDRIRRARMTRVKDAQRFRRHHRIAFIRVGGV